LFEFIQVLKELFESKFTDNSETVESFSDEEEIYRKPSDETKISQQNKQFYKIQNDIVSDNTERSKISTPVKSFVSTYKTVKKKDLLQSNISISDDKNVSNRSVISNTSFIKAEKIDYNKIYSKREKAELAMVRGIPKEFKKVEINGNKCIAFQFLRPTSLILDTDKLNIDRYKPSAEFVKTAKLKNRLEESTISPQTDRQSSIYKDSREVVKDISPIRNKDKTKEEFYYNRYQNNITDYYVGKNGDDIPSSLKNKLYLWIVDLNLIKENAIKLDDLPAICCNGVLLADIINRLEGVYLHNFSVVK
jgi:hypothetical protein